MDSCRSSTYGSCSKLAVQDVVQPHRLILFTGFLCLVVIGEGYDIGVLNGVVVRMQEDLGLSTWQISVVVTMTPMCLMPGALVGGVLADAIGRRGGLALCSLLLVIGPLGMALSSDVIALAAARALVGFAIGMGFVVVSMYITEVMPLEWRGRSTASEDVFLNVGMLLGFFVNWLLLDFENDWRWMLGFGSLLPLFVLVVVMMPQMPESPRWLCMKGRPEEAEKVLAFFLGSSQARQEIEAMTTSALTEHGSNEFVSWQRVLCSWHEPGVRQMLMAALTVAASQTLCGYLAIVYYSSTILRTSLSDKAAFLATALVGVVKLAVAVIAVVVLERIGRRPMLLASTVSTSLACMWLAIAFQVKAGALVQVIGFCLWVTGFSLGLGPITLLYVAEVFPTAWRGKGMAFALFISRIIGASSTLVFPVMIEEIGISTSFWILSGINMLLVFAVWAVVFETKGISLEDAGKIAIDTI